MFRPATWENKLPILFLISRGVDFSRPLQQHPRHRFQFSLRPCFCMRLRVARPRLPLNRLGSRNRLPRAAS